ncbi:MAG: RNA pyrophosphohydrolase [Boseongicola sp.]|nr:RNA pyrophosphohydrolase [Boseongicola sp.]NNL18288.1 RNA pyrophosphohydrolase [Boseongicola sp.]
MTNDLPYRPCAGVVLVNQNGLIFTGERVDTPGAWQMPQGGIDKGETIEEAALRELEEETGLPASAVTIEAVLSDWITYDLPKHLLGKMWKGRYRGQKQKWALLRFHGDDNQIDLTAHDVEFARWRWSTPEEVLRDIVPFKRAVYADVIDGFRDQLERLK